MKPVGRFWGNRCSQTDILTKNPWTTGVAAKSFQQKIHKASQKMFFLRIVDYFEAA